MASDLRFIPLLLLVLPAHEGEVPSRLAILSPTSTVPFLVRSESQTPVVVIVVIKATAAILWISSIHAIKTQSTTVLTNLCNSHVDNVPVISAAN